MSIYIRKKCVVPDCKMMGRNKGMMNGKRFYGNTCDLHHRKRHNQTVFYTHVMDRMPNKKCSICGWDKAYCDRHRINPKIGYVPENVLILCPNCHRLVTIGKLTP